MLMQNYSYRYLGLFLQSMQIWFLSGKLPVDVHIARHSRTD